MPSAEIFPNPVVKQVIFAIQFPNLFFIEKLVGDYQTEIMARFPTSELLFRRQFLLAQGDQDHLAAALTVADKDTKQETKLWQFESDDGVVLGLTMSSLSLTSTQHKTYNHAGAENRFRDLIEFACNPFLRLSNVPLLLRIGLRYVDECPIFENTTTSFANSYNSTLPTDHFPIESAREMQSHVVADRTPYRLRRGEQIVAIGAERKLILDFDAWGERVRSVDYLTTADDLHEIIWTEFAKSVKEPVFNYMRSEG